MIKQLLSSIFWGSTPNNYTFYQLYSKMRKWGKTEGYPYEYQLPEHISFPSEFWAQVIKLFKATRSDGYERAISVFWADGELILSSAIKGTTSSVTPSANIRVSYVPTKKREYWSREVHLDGKLYSKKDVYYKKAPKKIEVVYLFNMHTHPPHKREDGTSYYAFFSVQDLKSLTKSTAAITGMIGDKLWILIRTNNTPNHISLEQRDVTVENLSKQLHLGVYSGEWKTKLKRHNSVN